MGIERPKTFTREQEAPMVHVRAGGEAVPLNKEAAVVHFRDLTKKERSMLRKVIMAVSPRNVAAAASMAATAYITSEAVKEMPEPVAQYKYNVTATAQKTNRKGLQEAISQVAPEVFEMADGTRYTTRPEARPWQEDDKKITEMVEKWYEKYALEKSPMFDQYAETVAKEKTMGLMQAMFMTQEGQLLQGPTDLTEAAGYTPYEMTVSYQGGGPVGIPGLWSKPIKEDLSKQYKLELDDIKMRHVYKELTGNDPEEANSLADLIEKRVREMEAAEEATISELIEKYFHFDPPSLRNKPVERLYIERRLKDMLPAQIAQESLYNPHAVSVTGARGYLQIMPGTWKKHATEDMNITSLRDSLVVASKYYEAAYEYLLRNLATEFSQLETNHFGNDHKAFVEHFLINYLKNDYNAGDGNMKKVGQWFVSKYADPAALRAVFGGRVLKHKDVFFAFSKLATTGDTGSAYREKAGEYVKEIAGWEIVMRKLLQERSARLALK